jgi:phage terminase large subunit-like protein
MCEYGAEFSDSVTAWVDDETELRRCIVDKPTPTKGVGDVAYYMGIDLGLKNDGTAIVIVHKEDKKVILDYANVWFSGSSDVWELDNSIYHDCTKYMKKEMIKMQDMVNEIKELVKWFPIKQAIFDQSNGYGLAELLHNEKLKQFNMENFTDNKNSEVYQLLKNLYTEQLIELFDHPVLIPEMLSLEREQKSKRKIEVRAPARRGAHDDISDALARAVYICYKGDKEVPKRVATGAGGTSGGSPAGMEAQKIETQASFFIKKKKMHGDHPRGLYSSKRRKPNGSR